MIIFRVQNFVQYYIEDPYSWLLKSDFFGAGFGKQKTFHIFFLYRVMNRDRKDTGSESECEVISARLSRFSTIFLVLLTTRNMSHIRLMLMIPLKRRMRTKCSPSASVSRQWEMLTRDGKIRNCTSPLCTKTSLQFPTQ